MFQTKIEEKIKTHILRFSENHAIYEMMWKIRYSQTDHRWQYHTAHALCMMDE
jgi:hypothetical protein